MNTAPESPATGPRHPAECSSLEAQLLSLYGERQWIERELGGSSAAFLVGLARDLEQRLADARGASARSAGAGEANSAAPPPPHIPAHQGSPMDQENTQATEGLGIEEHEAAEEAPVFEASPPRTSPAQERIEPLGALPAGKLDQVVRALGLLAGELAPRFGSSELVVEGEVEGVRFSLRCQSPEGVR